VTAEVTKVLATASIELAGEAAMIEFGAKIARGLLIGEGLLTGEGLSTSEGTRKPIIMTRQGDLGAGNTTLSRGILQGLGHAGNVKSPTYTLVEPYQLAFGAVYHFDLYRLTDAEELEYMGFADYLTDGKLCLIEWPEQGQGFLPQADIGIQIRQLEEGRCVTLSAYSAYAEQLVSQLGMI
jgi:tRNA threonylcarbamoyladenosine biosynthesis protein TsaE